MIRWMLAALVLMALCAPAAAQNTTSANGNTIQFNGISFEFDSAIAAGVLAQRSAGDPANAQMPGGPTPPHTRFLFWEYAPFPEEDATFGQAAIYVIPVTSAEGYTNVQTQFDALRGLLDARPDLGVYTQTSASGDPALELPYLPTPGATQIIRAKPEYLENETLTGIRYLVAYAQDVSPLANWQVSYTFQGITRDGQHYVAANFRLLSGALPAEIDPNFDYDAFAQNYEQYLSDTAVLINEAAGETFQPALLTLDALVQSINVPAVAVEPPPSSLGALEGTWNLVSYDTADAPQPVLETAPVTLTFAADGVTGSAGCNNYFGPFSFDQGTIRFAGLGSTLMACDQPVMDQESAYLEALRTATAYQIEGDTLRITYPDGVLVFQRAG